MRRPHSIADRSRDLRDLRKRKDDHLHMKISDCLCKRLGLKARNSSTKVQPVAIRPLSKIGASSPTVRSICYPTVADRGLMDSLGWRLKANDWQKNAPTMPHSPKTAPIFWRTAAAITNMEASLTQGHGSSSPPMNSQPTGRSAAPKSRKASY